MNRATTTAVATIPPLAPLWARVLLGAAVGFVVTSAAAASLPPDQKPMILALGVAAAGIGLVSELGRGRPRIHVALTMGAALWIPPAWGAFVARVYDAGGLIFLSVFAAAGLRAIIAMGPSPASRGRLGAAGERLTALVGGGIVGVLAWILPAGLAVIVVQLLPGVLALGRPARSGVAAGILSGAIVLAIEAGAFMGRRWRLVPALPPPAFRKRGKAVARRRTPAPTPAPAAEAGAPVAAPSSQPETPPGVAAPPTAGEPPPAGAPIAEPAPGP